jgi:type IV pilus assembly protein PilM
MIKEIFLPQVVKGYYLFGQRIVGFDIGKTQVCATQIYLKGRSTIIEKQFDVPLENGTAANYNERASNAIAQIKAQLDPYDSIHTGLSSSVVIFKELKLPFLAYEKLKMIVPYEIEPLLPFAQGDAIIDFIITRQNIEQESSEILAAAVQNQHIAQHLQLFEFAGIYVDVITIDLFALYALYTKIPKFAHLQGAVILMDLAPSTTRVAYIQDGQLRFVRSLNKGFLHIAKAIGEKLNLQPQESIDQLMRYGFEKNTNQKFIEVINQEYKAFWDEVQVIIQSFTTQTHQTISRIVITGSGAVIKGISSFITTYLQIPTQEIQTSDIIDASITMKNKEIFPSSNIISLSVALPSLITEQFNLRKNSFALASDTLINKQLIVGFSLILALFLSLGINSYFQIRSMRNAAELSENEALNALLERKNFHRVLEEELKGTKDKDKLEEAINIAQGQVKKQEDLWFAFSGPARASILKYLLELTSKIDKEALGFTIESLAISEGAMTLKAQVKNHEALKLLEKDLASSPLFKYVPRQEQTNFTMKITLTTNRDEQQ